MQDFDEEEEKRIEQLKLIEENEEESNSIVTESLNDKTPREDVLDSSKTKQNSPKVLLNSQPKFDLKLSEPDRLNIDMKLRFVRRQTDKNILSGRLASK